MVQANNNSAQSEENNLEMQDNPESTSQPPELTKEMEDLMQDYSERMRLGRNGIYKIVSKDRASVREVVQDYEMSAQDQAETQLDKRDQSTENLPEEENKESDGDSSESEVLPTAWDNTPLLNMRSRLV